MPQQRHMCRRLYPDGTADEGLGASGPPREQFTDFDGVTWQLVTVVDRSDTADDRQLGIYRPVSSSDPLVSGPGGPRARTLRPGSTTDRKPGWSTRVRRLLASTASRKVRDQMTRGWTLDQLLDLTEAGYEVTRIARWSLDWTFSVAYVVRDPEAARWADAGFRPTGFSAARTKGWDLARGIRETTPRKPLTPAEEFVERHRRMGYGAAALENLREISEMRHPANEAREWWVVRYDGEGAISQSHGPFTRSEAMRRASSIGECSVTRVPPG